MNIEDLDKIHKELRKCRYFYYEAEEPKSLISDYDYDMLEKQYDKECDRLNIPLEIRVTNFVGFSGKIPISLISGLKIYSNDSK